MFYVILIVSIQNPEILECKNCLFVTNTSSSSVSGIFCSQFNNHVLYYKINDY